MSLVRYFEKCPYCGNMFETSIDKDEIAAIWTHTRYKLNSGMIWLMGIGLFCSESCERNWLEERERNGR